MLCNMDIYRFFSIVPKSDEDRGDFNVLQMISGFDGEFGPVSLSISAELDSREFDLHLNFIQTSASKPGLLFEFRTNELRYFVTQILPLFNPQNHFPDALPFPSPSQPSNP